MKHRLRRRGKCGSGRAHEPEQVLVSIVSFFYGLTFILLVADSNSFQHFLPSLNEAALK